MYDGTICISDSENTNGEASHVQFSPQQCFFFYANKQKPIRLAGHYRYRRKYVKKREKGE